MKRILFDHDATVSALVHSILLERCADPDLDPSPWANAITCFVLQQRAAMPVHTGMAVTWLTLLLDIWPLWRFGRPFHRLEHARRRVVMAGWQISWLAPCQDALRLYESLTLFAWHTRNEKLG
ncbi:MAG: hypothetical protein HQL63_15285 [Magnetococcales bacterium]|nr:hypothetical protein [Magnetococcales bacterium]MBF0323362.1 hypothetical protein [Magnetococcales bacterium]